MTKILVVEDDEANRELATRVLRREAYEVILANDGVAGVELALAESPDPILMDLSLPELDGWEATRQIRANPITAAIPIVALTAHAFAEEVQRALQAGCNQYETKPLDYRRLTKKTTLKSIFDRAALYGPVRGFTAYSSRKGIGATMTSVSVRLSGWGSHIHSFVVMKIRFTSSMRTG